MIIHENEKKELIDVDTDTDTLRKFERIVCPFGFSTVIPIGYYFKVVP